MGPEVHLRLTRLWAAEEGFSEMEARSVSEADLVYDLHFPARASLKNITRHFAPTAWWWSARYMREALRRRDLRMLGFALHTAQDAIAHGRFGEKHLLLRAGWGRDPDVWELAPAGVKRRIEAATRARLRRYRAGG